MEGKFPVGEFLSQRMLAEETGAVVITVRSCLRRLENEGLIENVPKWGVRIPIDTPEKVRDRYFMREVLEVAALARLRENMNDDLKRELLRIAKKCDEMEKDSPDAYRKFAEAHNEFHSLIAKASGSELLMKFLGQMNLRSIMLYNARRIWATREPDDSHYHEKYAEIIMNAPWAEALGKVKEHIQKALDAELQVLKS